MVGCFVVGCKTGYGGKGTYHNFKLPRSATEDIKQKWRKNIPKRADRNLDFKTCFVCHNHFEEKYIIKSTKIMMRDQVVQEIPRKHWTLTNDAIPTIFSNDTLSTSFNKTEMPRRPPKIRRELPPVQFKIRNDNQGSESHDDDSPIEIQSEPAADTQIFTENKLMDMSLPLNWMVHRTNEGITFSKLKSFNDEKVPTFFAEIQLILSTGPIISIKIRNMNVTSFFQKDIDSIKTLNCLKEFISTINTTTICEGVMNFKIVSSCENLKAFRCGNSWIADDCQIFMQTEEKLCHSCSKLKHVLQVKSTEIMSQKMRTKKKIVPTNPLIALRKKNSKSTRLIRRLRVRNSSLKAERKELIKKFRTVEINSLTEAIEKSDLEPQFKLALKTAACLQKSKSSKRYPGDWLLQALLLKITSPKAYRHLRQEGILPLPHPNHIAKLIRGIKCEFGFNQFVLSRLKLEYSSKQKRDRQVFLLFYEMKVKEAVDFNKLTMQFTGFIDYKEFSADQKQRRADKLEADHALVFMVRALNSSMTQPIAAFATRGAAPGSILSKMIISAILKLEETGMEVIGVVSDGATSNKSAWNFLNISGREDNIQNRIANPFDEKRSVYFICDIPHVIKCIRNNFHKKTVVSFNGSIINWGFYQALYDLDREQNIRAVPKLTPQHVNPGPFQKMSVAKAVQIFSKSVADAIRFYRDVIGADVLKYSEATEEFTRRLNALFDALNARIPTQGITPGSLGYQVISEFLSNLKSSDTFAAEVTITSIRVTLQSTLDLVKYLCNELGFAYVLTAKFNQDCLEKFFGLIRSFGGDNCHPTVTTFGHLFRLLSIYNPTRRAIQGNVNCDEEVNVYVASYLELLRSLRNEKEAESRERKKIMENQLLSTIVYNVNHGSESDSQNPCSRATKSICYHLSGYIAFKRRTFTDCLDCHQCLVDESFRPPEAGLTMIKDCGGLLYPSMPLFVLLSEFIEPHLAKLCPKDMASKYFVSQIVDNLSEVNCHGLGCNKAHSEDLCIKIIIYYLTIRMYFHSKLHNREVLTSISKSKQKIKEGKLQ